MKNVRKKMLHNFLIIISLVLAIFTMMVITIIYFTSKDLLAVILTLASIGLLLVLLKVYGKLQYLRHEYVLFSLLENKEKPIHSKKGITDIYNSQILTSTLNYTHHLSNNEYSIYYKIQKGFSKKNRHKTLFAVLILNPEASFVGNISTKAFEDLEKYLHKKEKYSQRVFIQLKNAKNGFNEDNINDTDKIFFLSHRKNNIVVINLLFNQSNQKVYYLHSNKIKMPIYLNLAYTEIKSILS